MTAKKKRILIFLALLLGVALSRIPYSALDEKCISLISEFAKETYSNIYIQRCRVHFPLVAELSGVRGSVGAVPFALTKAQLKLKMLSLFALKLHVTGELELFGGRADLAFERRFFSSRGEYSLEADGIQLERYPLLQYQGVQGRLFLISQGEIAYEEDGARFLHRSHSKLSLTGGHAQAGLQLSPLIKLPELREVRGVLLANTRQENIRVSEFAFDSSLAKLDSKGMLEVNRLGQIKDIEFNGTAELSPEGVDVLGGYLELAAGLSQGSGINKWGLSVFNESGKGLQIKVFPSNTK